MPSKIKRSDKWKKKQLTDEDKKNIKMAIASYVIATKQVKKFPAYSIEEARKIVPYVEDEDAKWANIDTTKVTATPKFLAFKNYIDLIRNTLRSENQMKKHIALVEDRKK